MISKSIEFEGRAVQAGEIIKFASKKELKCDHVYAKILNIYVHEGTDLYQLYVKVLHTQDKSDIGSNWYVRPQKVEFLSKKEQKRILNVIEVMNG